ncbi:EAL domain-containing protein [Halomonas sp. BC1]|uniref:EAL domain-containing protein n=1 Tax=Halomonas sp. BC1 TaxID=1670448 RepID=UPI0015945656|nr:EAL domain-containing protein [Halomonas sp. BC1]
MLNSYDRSFISGLPNSSKDRAIVESLLRLCQGFERHVCAEGIENFEQMAYLRDLRCDRAQGYALGRPGPGLHFDRPSTPVEIEPDIEDTFIET